MLTWLNMTLKIREKGRERKKQRRKHLIPKMTNHIDMLHGDYISKARECSAVQDRQQPSALTTIHEDNL